jgi:hypothetical protein
MTLLAASRFRDGAIIISDNPLTWISRDRHLFQDSLQKILPIGPRIIIGYAGDDRVGPLIVQKLLRRIQVRPRLRALPILTAYFPKIAKHYYQEHGRFHRLAFVLGGVSSSEHVEVWWYESPFFETHRLENRFIVKGSGEMVHHYLQNNFDRLDQDLPDLKARADSLLSGLTTELEGKKEITLGDLFQVIMLDSVGIRPLRDGFLSIDPEELGPAKGIDIKGGRWVQSDFVTGKGAPLVEPSRVLMSASIQSCGHENDSPYEKSATPKWHLTYFLTCLEVQAKVGTIEFRNISSAFSSLRYPLSLSLIAAIGFWGMGTGDFEMEFGLVKNEQYKPVHTELIHMKYPPEEVDLARKLSLQISEPGPAFLESRIAGQVLGRRALYFSQAIFPKFTTEAETTKFFCNLEKSLFEEQRACSDPLIEKTGYSSLVYFSICQNYHDSKNVLRFERQIAAVFWRDYPVKLRTTIVSAFHMPRGKHQVQVTIVNAMTGESFPIAAASVESSSSCFVTPIHGQITVIIPRPGWYLINIFVDNRLVGTSFLAAETNHSCYFYEISPEAASEVADGKLLLLSKRAEQKLTYH